LLRPVAALALVEMGDRIEIVGLPTIEFYRTTTIKPNEPMNQTDICIPIIRRQRQRI
jgi:hypothetical protein